MFLSKSDNYSNYIKYEGITFEVVKRNVRYFRVEFKSRIPKIILPYGTNPEKILAENFLRIRKKYNGFLDHMENADKLGFFKREKEEFENIVNDLVNHFSDELGVKVKLLKYRKMRRMWGNCRSNGVITLNSKLSLLPGRIISYIVYHEMLHLSEKGGHTIKFKRRMKEKFKDIKNIETVLKVYFIKFDNEDVNIKNSL